MSNIHNVSQKKNVFISTIWENFINFLFLYTNI